ncbi:hypothetical protein LSTR_LSTR015422 [Laodelphax striatellus]|uniref:Uncharacterized protein n=1 Tax=Laodelphax striatellus TaxID=195883 RepID=A0A482X766_LAOST|nr:hypothetical protein LSTR_LSTR015422 [Laodelphax striatellus]
MLKKSVHVSQVGQASYARAAEGGLRGVRAGGNELSRTLVVAPEEKEGWTAETTLKKMREVLKPAEVGFQVVQARRMAAKRGWKLVLGSEEQVQSVLPPDR